MIGGEWRGRVLRFHSAEGLRPTTDRLRETLFNWLQWEIRGSRCLDLFAGSGALGFEAASRGAASVVMVENNPASVRQLKRNVERLRADQIEVNHADAIDFLSGNHAPFDIVFVDPPFEQLQVECTCAGLEQRGSLKANALVYVETSYRQTYQLPAGWSALKSTRAGQVRANLYRRQQSADQ